MHKPREVVRILASLFPDSVRVSAWSGGPDVPLLFPDEAEAIASSVQNRRVEFARGRACAREALEQVGFTPGSIPVGPGRQPLWPRGAVGSITHCDGLVAAAAVRDADVAGLGIDVEVGGALDDDIIETVCTPGEIAMIRAQPSRDAGVWFKMLFSAKESVHKVIYPRTSEWLDFLDVELSVDFVRSGFRVRPATDRSAAVVDLGALHGRFQFFDGFVATGVTLPVGAGRRQLLFEAADAAT